MASSRKPRSGSAGAEAGLEGSVGKLLASLDLRGKRVLVGLSGGVDSVVLLHVLKSLAPANGYSLRALHVHHGLSPNAAAWAAFCRSFCAARKIPLQLRKVKVARTGEGPEAAAREARYGAFRKASFDALVLAHHLDDQAETVLINLLRGAGARGASGMAMQSRLGDRLLLRPLLGVPREAIVAYAGKQGLTWVEDESNADETLTRNFFRRRVGPLLASRFPRWRESLARAARHFSAKELDGNRLLREFLAAQGLRAPSEAKLVEMLKQLTGGGARTTIEHDGKLLRSYRGTILLEEKNEVQPFRSLAWRGERRLPIPALGGELRFRRVRGKGFALDSMGESTVELRLRGGGERLQLDPKRPRRTLKNLFQEAGVPPWQRDRLPLLFSGDQLVWAPGLGIDARFQAASGALGWVPEWCV